MGRAFHSCFERKKEKKLLQCVFLSMILLTNEPVSLGVYFIKGSLVNILLISEGLIQEKGIDRILFVC